jgi:hypothetical protein
MRAEEVSFLFCVNFLPLPDIFYQLDDVCLSAFGRLRALSELEFRCDVDSDTYSSDLYLEKLHQSCPSLHYAV